MFSVFYSSRPDIENILEKVGLLERENHTIKLYQWSKTKIINCCSTS